VKFVGLTDERGGRARSSGIIYLPTERKYSVLRHGVDHPVAYADGGDLGKLWALVLWDGDRPRWNLPSRYARTSPADDFAESYRAFLEGERETCCVERVRFMRESVLSREGHRGQALQPRCHSLENPPGQGWSGRCRSCQL
jgi:hypothetical protein